MSRRLLIGLVLVDAPVLAAVAVVGSLYGFIHTYEAVVSWRLEHPWSFLPSVALAGTILYRRRRARRHALALRPLELEKVPR